MNEKITFEYYTKTVLFIFILGFRIKILGMKNIILKQFVKYSAH